MTKHTAQPRIVHLRDLIPDDDNARKHTPRNIGMIEQAVSEVGAARSGVADENLKLLAGNGTAEALAAAGIERVMLVPSDGKTWVVVQRDGLSEEQKRKLALYDNRSGDLATWEPEVMARLDEQGFLSDMFFPEELEPIIAEVDGQSDSGASDDNGHNEPETPTDRAEALREHYGVERGQVWRVGRHRVMCGDSYSDIPELLAGAEPDILHGDPPYGINVVNSGNELKRLGYKEVQGDDRPFDPEPFLSIAPQTVLWGANHYAERLPSSSFWLVWDKQGDKSINYADCELAWSNVGKPARCLRHIWDGFRRDSEQGAKRFHPTQKPVAVIEWALSWFDGDTVVEPFLGAGSTLLASDRAGLTCYGMEIDPAYVAVTLERAAQTGLDPVLL